MALLLSLSGMAIAAGLITSVALPSRRLTRSRPDRGPRVELYRFGCGRSHGAVAVGQVIDGWGAQAGFIGVAIAGLLLAFSALFVRGPTLDPNLASPRGEAQG